MASTSGGQESAKKSVGFSDLTDTKDAKMRQDHKDEKLCDVILEVLGRVDEYLLAGEAGIGKTRLAKMVGERATQKELCFLTLCLHLNNKFEDEWSLYENIASRLSVYPDFEETEVDDRDEDEEDEKKLKADDLKKLIIDEILRQKTEAIEKEKKEAEKANKEVKNVKDKPLPAKGEKQSYSSDSDVKTPYLLLILDDEGNKTTQHEVMKDLKLEEFLKDVLLRDVLLKDVLLKVDTPLKILVTRRKGYEEATKPGGGNDEQEDTKSDSKSEAAGESEQENDEQDDSKSDSKTESAGESKQENDEQDNSKSDRKTESAGESEQENDEQDDSKSDRKSEPAEEIESEDKDNEAQVSDKAQDSVRDGGNGPSAGASSNAATECDDKTGESEALRNSINEDNLRDLFLSLTTEEDWKTYEEFIPDIVKKSKNSPAAIFVLAKSLTWITQSKKPSDPSDQENKEELKEKIDKKIREVFSADRYDPSDPGSSSESATNPILYLAYELLEINQINRPSMDAILDCFWHSLDFFEHCGCVYYRDLITQWMLEGYFDPVRSVEKAYQAGHSILMELINRGMLKIQENNVVVPEMTMRNVIDPRRRGHLGRSRLRFSRVYGGNKNKGIGKITQLDDMIKTVQAKKGDKITTILVGGDRLRRITPKKYFSKLGGLEVLVLFEPTLDPFIPCFKELAGIRVLVIRDYDLLDSIEDLKTLTKLNALEVSGASSLKTISDKFFEAFLELQSLHLSGLQITSSPSSISGLTELHCLIIKDCPLLEGLPNIQELVKLEVVDISGARGLQTCFDNTKGDKKDKSKNKNFYHLTKLQLLDFSESQIERLPIFQDSAVAEKKKTPHSLTRLLLRNCSKLRRLPSLKPLSGLQILDLSGTTSLVEMLEVCFEDKMELKTLNLSGTNLSELATTIEDLSSLNELLLRDCTNLKVLPNIEKLTNLEVIDVSGSLKLESIEGSFEKMSYLREVNLSGTKVKTPELPKESKIYCLKRIILADGRRFEGKDWSEVRIAMSSEISEDPSSSDAVVESQDISEETGEIQSDEPPASDCTEKGDVSKERLLQFPIERVLYKNVLFFDSASPQEVMEINETNELDGDALANAEFVSFVDCSSTRLTSIFNKTKSVKGCWLRMCIDIKDLFSGVAEEHLGSLETFSITNLPSLETISCVASFKNLKNLSIDCCPKIKTIFPEMPSSLEVLNIKHCEKLEKVVTGAELSTLTNLVLKVKNCPNFEGNPEDLEYVMVEHSDASPQD